MNSEKEKNKRAAKKTTEAQIEEKTEALVEEETESSSEDERAVLVEENTEALAEEESESSSEDVSAISAEEETEALVNEETDSLIEEDTEALAGEETEALMNEETDSLVEEDTEALAGEETEALVNEETDSLVEEETEALAEEETEALVEVLTEPYIIENTESLIFKQQKKFKYKKPFIIIGSIILGLILIGGGIAGYFNYQRITAINTGLKNGEALLTQANYEEAMKSFEAVSTIDTNNADAIFGKAKAYAGIGDSGNAKTYFEDTLKRVTDLEKLKLVFNAYIDSEVNAKVGEEEIFTLLDQAAKETGDESYIKRKGEYMIKTPSFNLNPGTYQGVQTVDIIKGETTDKIYFTTDGSQPTTTSPEYTTVIQLAPGEMTVKAIEVGANGYPSKTIEGKYIISASSESILENNISGSWSYRSGSSFYQYYFNNGQCSYSYTYGNGSKTTSTGNYQIVGCNPSGTIATLSVFNMTGYSLSSTININCEPLGDNRISINSMGYTYSP